MPEEKKSKAPIEDPVLAKLVKQSECSSDGNKTKMLMYNKAEFVRAKFDKRPDCVVRKGKCSSTLDAGEKQLILPEEKISKKMKLEQTQPPCPKPNTRPSHAPVFDMGHRIRMCTIDELKQACPEPCMKPTRPPKPKFLYRIGSLALKVAIAGSLVWWTYDIGLWGDGYHSEKIWQGTVNALFPREKKEETNIACPAAIERGVFEFRDAYNRTAIAVTSALANLPYSIVPKSMLPTTKADHEGLAKVSSTSGTRRAHGLL